MLTCRLASLPCSPTGLRPLCPSAQGKGGWSLRLVSTLKFRLSVWPQPHSGARSFRSREGGEGLPGPAEVAARGKGYPETGLLRRRLFTSLCPTPVAADPPRWRSVIGRAACQSLGTFPGGGAARPPALPSHRPCPLSPTRGPVQCCGARDWPRPLPRPWTRAGRGERGAVSPGPHPQVSRPGGAGMERNGVWGWAGPSLGSPPGVAGGRSGPDWWPGFLVSWAPAPEVPGRRAPPGAAGSGRVGNP